METTIVKCFRVLEALALQARPMALAEVSEAADLSKSNAHRLLQTLEGCGFVNREAVSQKYSASLRMWELGAFTFDRMDLRALARPHLETLASETEETVHLSVFDRNEALFLDKIDGSHAVRTYVNVGDRAPCYCSASGKALLAHMPDDIVAAVGQTITQHTDQTVRNADELRQHLQRVRDRGYSLTNGEWRMQVTGVSTAVLSETGKVICAIGVAGPQSRMQEQGLERYVEAVERARHNLRRDMGFASDLATKRPLEEFKRTVDGAKRRRSV